MGSKTTSPIRCVLDTRNLTADAYRLPGETSRKWKSQATLRMRLADYLATYANGDGTRIETGIKSMAAKLDVCPRTINNLLADLQTLGFLTNGTLTGFKGTRSRALNVPVMVAAKSDAHHSPDTHDSAPPVAHHSDDSCASFAGQLRIIDSPDAHHSRPVAQNSADFCAQPSVGPRDREPTVHQPGRSQNLGREEGGGLEENLGATPQTPTPETESEVDDENAEPEMTPEEEAEQERSWQKHIWEDFLCELPKEMRGAVFTTEQEKQLREQVNKNVYTLARAVKLWVESRERPIEERKFNKWGCWLSECAPFIKQQREIARESLRNIPAAWRNKND